MNRLAVAVPDWLRLHLDPGSAERSGPRFDACRLPKGQAEREALADQIRTDGFPLLQAIYAPDAPTWLREFPAGLDRRQVQLQQYHAPEDDGIPSGILPRICRQPPV